MHNPLDLPANLPVPVDDGACAHLRGQSLPDLQLRSTQGSLVPLGQLKGRTVLYCYPRTGQPGQPLPTGWDDIPGARGCTPQACAFRDHYQELLKAGASRVFGLSTQDTDYQREVVDRLHLPFPILSDSDLIFAGALKLPTFEVDGMTLIKRLTLIIDGNRIIRVFYPVFPPDRSAEETLQWLITNPPPVAN
jgi:peroxiredoxin